MNAQSKIAAPSRRLYSPSETDLTVEDNVIQARFELDRADHDPARLAVWMERWARSAIDALQNPAFDGQTKADLEKEITDLEARVEGLESAIPQFIATADAVMEKHKPNDAYVNDLNEAIGKLEGVL